MYSAPAYYTPLSHWTTPVNQGYSHAHYHQSPAYQSYAPAYPAYDAYAPAYSAAHNHHNVNQTVGYGNYGYGVYSQDVGVHRNPYTGRPMYERELDFVPLGHNHYQPYTGYPAAIHQHYVR